MLQFLFPYQIIELVPQQVLQSHTDYRREEDKTKPIRKFFFILDHLFFFKADRPHIFIGYYNLYKQLIDIIINSIIIFSYLKSIINLLKSPITYLTNFNEPSPTECLEVKI